MNSLLIPNSTIIRQGVVQVCLLATPQKLFIVPKQQFSGAGMTTTTTTFTIADKNPAQGLQELQSTLSNKELEEKLTQIITQDWGLPAEDFIISPKECPEFEIKMGLLSKGIYYKRTPNERRQVIAGTKKDQLTELKNMYGF